MKRVFLVLSSLLLLAAPARAHQLESGADPWFADHVFVGEDGCLLVRQEQRLARGDSLTIFQAGRPAETIRVEYLVRSDSAKSVFDKRGFKGVYDDPALWRRYGCWWGFSSAYPGDFAIARYASPDTDFDVPPPVAILGLPASAIAIGGDRQTLQPDELAALHRMIARSLPRIFAGAQVLRAGYRSRSSLGHEMIELFLGTPAYRVGSEGAPIDSIEICRVYVYRAHVLAWERFSRVSGQEEHVDVEPPQLDEQNWFQTSEETLGYVSWNRGETWRRLSVDVGFEGIAWMIHELSESMPRTWTYYLYTSH